MAPIGAEEQQEDRDDEVDVAERVGRERPVGELVEEDAVDEAGIADDRAGEVEVHQRDDEQVAEVDEIAHRLVADGEHVDDEGTEAEGDGEQSYQHDAVPEERGHDGAVEVHHHRTEGPDGDKDHVELEGPIEAVFLVLEEAKDDKCHI